MTRAEQIMDKISDRLGADKTTTEENLETLKQLKDIIELSIETLTKELKKGE